MYIFLYEWRCMGVGGIALHVTTTYENLRGRSFFINKQSPLTFIFPIRALKQSIELKNDIHITSITLLV